MVKSIQSLRRNRLSFGGGDAGCLMLILVVGAVVLIGLSLWQKHEEKKQQEKELAAVKAETNQVELAKMALAAR